LVFFSFARFFSGFFRFGSVFPVPGLKNQNRTEPVGFFKILISLIGFFSQFGFFNYFFSGFLGLIGFLVFLNTPTYKAAGGEGLHLARTPRGAWADLGTTWHLRQGKRPNWIWQPQRHVALRKTRAPTGAWTQKLFML